MPLTAFQLSIARALAPNRSNESHLAGGAAIHLSLRSKRYSNDLDYFHDSEERVGSAFNLDRQTLATKGFEVSIEVNLKGYVRAVISKDGESTKVEWAHDSAWRFMPAVKSEDVGYVLHDIDLAINKLLALAGRDEARDFLDILYVHENVLPIGALCWAAVGKDPGFSPLSLLEMLKRRGRYRPEDMARLKLTQPVNLQDLKQQWLAAINSAEAFIRSRPPEESGCLYYSKTENRFFAPDSETAKSDFVLHFGGPGGVIPQIL